MAKITNTGQLRELLCDVINRIDDNTIEPHKVKAIVKLAGQINDNLYAEVKVVRTQLQTGATREKFGALKLGDW
tara:strand:+ start:1481 stop:1702 length:222 start_codon:yes stop_codon:yes gene_type:complete